MSSPEPMSLGSPSQSPVVSNQYLPQYLLGESSFSSSTQLNTRNSPKFWLSGNSPPRSATISRSFSISNYDAQSKYQQYNVDKNESLYNSPSSQNIHGSHHHHHHHHHNHHNHSQLDRSQDNRPSAPPINRLIDTLNKPAQINTIQKLNSIDSRKLSSVSSVDSYERTVAHDLSLTPTARISPPSPTQIDPFYIHGESIKVDDKFDETWITVFGFPASATSFILQEFSIYGQILKYVPSSGGNWMHIQYLTKLHAQKALSKNGKILANSIMIGVLPCIDKKVMQQSPSNDENISKFNTSPPDSIAMSKSNEFKLQSDSRLSRTASLRSSIRPLGSSNRIDREIDSTYQDAKLPRKNTNVISKAMEYMFGW